MLETSGRRGRIEEEEGGLKGSDLARAAWRAFRQARDGVGFAPVPEDLADVDEDVRERFLTALAWAVEQLEKSAESEGLTWSGTAAGVVQRLYTAEDAALGVITNIDVLASAEAMVRHVANAMEWDGAEGDLSDHESGWREWAARRAGMAGPASTMLEVFTDGAATEE